MLDGLLELSDPAPGRGQRLGSVCGQCQLSAQCDTRSLGAVIWSWQLAWLSGAISCLNSWSLPLFHQKNLTRLKW